MLRISSFVVILIDPFMKFLTSLLMVLSFASHGMAASLPELEGRPADAGVTNGQKTALHGVHQARNLAFSVFSVCWILDQITNSAPKLLINMMPKSLLSGLILTSVEAALLQPISAKNVMLSAPLVTLPVAYLWGLPPHGSKSILQWLLKGSSVMYLAGVALSCKDWYQERHKSHAGDGSKPTPMTPQARALQGVRSLKHLASLIFSINHIFEYSPKIMDISGSFAASLAGLETLLAQPISAKNVMLSVPGIAVPLSTLFYEDAAFESKNIDDFLMVGSCVASCAGNIWSLKDWYQGRGKPETPVVKMA